MSFAFEQKRFKQDPERYAGKICDDCNHDIECEECDVHPCYKQKYGCDVHFEDCDDIMTPFVVSIFQLREMRGAQIPQWAEDLTPAEIDGILLCDQLSVKLEAEHYELMKPDNG